MSPEFQKPCRCPVFWQTFRERARSRSSTVPRIADEWFKTGRAVREILKTNNAVELSFACAVLKDAGIEAVVFDTNMSVLDGSMVILPQRLMVLNEDEIRARVLLKEAFAALSPLT